MANIKHNPITSGVRSIENHPLKRVMQTANKVTIPINRVSLVGVIGLHSFNNKTNPVTTVRITQILAYASTDKLQELLINAIIKILATVVSAVGIDFVMTFRKKCPLILSLFGSKAKKKDGIPIVTNAIKLS